MNLNKNVSVLNISRPLIAVIDDEVDILDFYFELFSEYFEVKSFSSPQLFLDTLFKGDLAGVSLVLADYTMPKLTGLEMIEKAHQAGFVFPALLLSGNISKNVAVSALNSGINKVLEKPAEPEVILQTASQLIKDFQIANLEDRLMDISEQLQELYMIYRDLLIPEELGSADGVLQANSDGLIVKAENPLQLVTRLEMEMVRLQLQKKEIRKK